MTKDEVTKPNIRSRVVYGMLILTAMLPMGDVSAQAQGEYLYNVTLLRATPGHFNDLMESLRVKKDLLVEAGDVAPFWIRHSQGDHWDFMLIYPVGDYSAYFSDDRARARSTAWGSTLGKALAADLESFIAYQEEWIAASVSIDEMQRRFDGMDFYHIEMFAGIPGKREELLEQRRMENRYYEHLNRQQNLIFVRNGGSNWDAMTIGFYESLQTYVAAGALYTEAEQDEAAKVAGFSGINDISPYLRSLLSYHNDTLGVSAQ